MKWPRAEVHLRTEWRGSLRIRGHTTTTQGWVWVREPEVYSVPPGVDHYPSWHRSGHQEVGFPTDNIIAVLPLE